MAVFKPRTRAIDPSQPAPATIAFSSSVLGTFSSSTLSQALVDAENLRGATMSLQTAVKSLLDELKLQKLVK